MFKGSLGSAVPNAEVVKIERIQNPRLYEIFEGQKKRMSNGGNEMRLFHGTAKDAVKNINMSGFNRVGCGKNGKLICFVTFRHRRTGGWGCSLPPNHYLYGQKLSSHSGNDGLVIR